MNVLDNFSTFYVTYLTNPEATKLWLVQEAADELFVAVRGNYYGPSDLERPNYAEICEWLEWPNFQDGGIFEQAIDVAANMVLKAMGWANI